MRRSLLKTERRQRAIVSAAFGKARAEQARVRQQVRRHERAIAVAADADAIAIADAHIDDLIDGRFGTRDQLLDVFVVGRFAGTDDRHGRVIKNGVTGQQQEQMRIAADEREPIRRTGDLAGRVRVAELARISPHDYRQTRALVCNPAARTMFLKASRRPCADKSRTGESRREAVAADL